jgi:hypothetical protein
MIRHASILILAVVGVEGLVALAARSGQKLRALAFATETSLAIVRFVRGAPVPQVQIRVLLSVAIGIGAGIAAELHATRPRARQAASLVLVAALAVSVGLAAIMPARKLGVLAEHGFALTADARAARDPCTMRIGRLTRTSKSFGGAKYCGPLTC